MSPMQILFLIVAVVTLGSALMVVSARNLVHSALWLVLALFGVAVFFVMLDAAFLAVAQVVIYIGAIAILVIFAIMLTRKLATVREPQVNQNWVWAAAIAALLFAGISWMLSSWGKFSATAPELAAGTDPTKQLGLALVSPTMYVLPFEVASVLLVAALIGAIMIAWDRKV